MRKLLVWMLSAMAFVLCAIGIMGLFFLDLTFGWLWDSFVGDKE